MMNRKLGRKSEHRDHLMRNLLTSLVLYEQVETTEAKTKELKSMLDQVIARSKANDLAAARRLYGLLFDRNAVDKVLKELLPRYKDRQSGFTRLYHLQNRAGDNAPMARLELIDKKVFVEKREAKVDQIKTVKTEANITIKKRGDKTEKNDGKK